MINIFKKIFSNRFCCGWIVGIGAMALVEAQQDNWWGYITTMVIIIAFYLVFRRLALRYLDE